VRNIIDLAGTEVTVVAQPRQPEAFSVNTRARSYQLVAETPTERDEWVQAIRYVFRERHACLRRREMSL